jgi:hypothetical protein
MRAELLLLPRLKQRRLPLRYILSPCNLCFELSMLSVKSTSQHSIWSRCIYLT